MATTKVKKRVRMYEGFGRAFATRKLAKAYVKGLKELGTFGVPSDLAVRLMPKKLFPRRKNRYHVGGAIDYLNFG